jgi:hypothetical protein
LFGFFANLEKLRSVRRVSVLVARINGPKEVLRRMQISSERSERNENAAENETQPRKLRLFGHEFTLPRSRALRIAIGILLIFGGMLGFLPILGFWMIPLGFVVLSFENHHLRRLRRRIVVKSSKRSKKDS